MTQNNSTTTLNSSDGLALFCRAWQPTDTPIATLVIVHGLGEHSERYNHVASHFVNKNYAVFALDLRGHGRSEGQRGHINSIQDYLNDVKALITYAKNQTPDIPLFLLGHSMGGVTVLAYSLKYPADINAVLASGPGLMPKVHVPAWKAILGKIMSRLYPTLSLANGISPDTVSRDKAVVEAYIADPLVHDQVSARWYTEIIAAGQHVLNHANTLTIPALILQGSDDLLVDPVGAKQFFDGITLSDKHHIEYPKLYHEILNEPEQQTVLADIETWLTPRI